MVRAGACAPARALAFGIGSGRAGALVLGTMANWLAAALALPAALYVGVYTLWLKRTPHNIVIGGSAGAVPPLVGWAAVTGASTSPPGCSSPSSSTGRPRTSGRSR